MDILFILALTIFIVSFLTMVFEVFDKALVAMVGAILMIITGILSFDEAIEAIDFETIGLLMGMMILVDIASSSGVFSWLNVKIARLTGGQPWRIFLLFVVVTALFSAFLDNVTTMLIIVPVVMSLAKGMGLNSRFLLVSLVMFANIGGALTLIGDPTNIIIGSAAKLNFNDFIQNLFVPISMVASTIVLLLGITRWPSLRPTHGNLRQLFVSHLLIEKIHNTFGREAIKPKFVFRVISILLTTILAFVFQPYLGIPVSVISIAGALTLLVITTEHSCIHQSLSKVEWPTLFFFAGLFVMVAALEQVGLLEMIGDQVIAYSDDYLQLVLIIMWSSAFVSMMLDNIPFVTVMVPIIFQVQPFIPAGADINMMWWALSLGACLGACGTPVGSSANVVGLGMGRKHGVDVSFLGYMRIAFPLTMVALSICSIYFWMVI